MEDRELLMKAENYNGSVIFEKDDHDSLGDALDGVFIVTVKTKNQFCNCIAKFNSYELAKNFFRNAIKEYIYAQEITIPISQFLWMTQDPPED